MAEGAWRLSELHQSLEGKRGLEQQLGSWKSQKIPTNMVIFLDILWVIFHFFCKDSNSWKMF